MNGDTYFKVLYINIYKAVNLIFANFDPVKFPKNIIHVIRFHKTSEHY